MALKTMLDELNAARKAYDDKRRAIGNDARAAVGAFLGPLIPPGYVLAWTQYTPHFNDGDTCTFSVHEPELVREGGEYRRGEGMSPWGAAKAYGTADQTKTYETDDHDAWDRLSYAEQRRINALDYNAMRAARPKKTVSYVEEGFPAIEGYGVEKLEELTKAWSSLPEDFMQQAFGDHVRVTVGPDGIAHTNDHDHD